HGELVRLGLFHLEPLRVDKRSQRIVDQLLAVLLHAIVDRPLGDGVRNGARDGVSHVYRHVRRRCRHAEAAAVDECCEDEADNDRSCDICPPKLPLQHHCPPVASRIDWDPPVASRINFRSCLSASTRPLGALMASSSRIFSSSPISSSRRRAHAGTLLGDWLMTSKNASSRASVGAEPTIESVL